MIGNRIQLKNGPKPVREVPYTSQLTNTSWCVRCGTRLRTTNHLGYRYRVSEGNSAFLAPATV